ncbi:hypothetical protein ABIC20_004191 [Methylobacterium radiotolerans]|uniref:D-isomer specific 2-hydroxyacid dehydrogenase catalytic domain-containing protein n=1 Tax=Methylobacterium radiotolerans TaxID=31998 RepID=A0ABV2NK43_9HYPH
MAVRKRVCRFNVWINPVFDARLGAEPDIDLQVGDLQGPDDVLAALLARAHVLHVSPARDELPRRWHVTDALLAECPDLLAVSSAGAGFDTVDAAACTRAGVAVVNQVGGNARSVAELAIGLMLAVSRKICVSDRLLRTARGFTRESLMGHEIGGATLGLIGIGHTGRERSPSWPAASTCGSSPTTPCSRAMRSGPAARSRSTGRDCSPSPTSCPCTAPSTTRPAAASTPRASRR